MAAEFAGYENFDLLLTRGFDGCYRAKVIASPAGEGAADFQLAVNDTELENLVLRLSRSNRANRSLSVQDVDKARAYGSKLFEAIFSGSVRDCLRSSVQNMRAVACGVRIRLRFDQDVGELNNLPWELLFDASRKQYLTLNYDTPLVRYADLGEAAKPLTIKPPLRVLVVVASPEGMAALDGDREYSLIAQSVRPLAARGLIELARLDRATLGSLRSTLDRGTYHILHYIGHGGFNEARRVGQLMFEREDRRADLVDADRLATVVSDHRALRLVVLNACEGARISAADPYGGSAQMLVLQGVPAVVAMQFEISDPAAITFAETFYADLATGRPVDRSLSAARKAIYASEYEVEWATPVLYMRAPDGVLFSIDAEATRPAPPAFPPPSVETPTPEALKPEAPKPGAPKPGAASTLGLLLASDAAAKASATTKINPASAFAMPWFGEALSANTAPGSAAPSTPPIVPGGGAPSDAPTPRTTSQAARPSFDVPPTASPPRAQPQPATPTPSRGALAPGAAEAIAWPEGQVPKDTIATVVFAWSARVGAWLSWGARKMEPWRRSGVVWKVVIAYIVDFYWFMLVLGVGVWILSETQPAVRPELMR